MASEPCQGDGSTRSVQQNPRLGSAVILFGCERPDCLLSDTSSLPLPGAVAGLLRLLFGLMLYDRVPRGLAGVNTPLPYLLPLLFLPAAVGVFLCIT
ncbi:CidA/LrgA family protein [Microbulbifer sp. 2304DJ12-6]|uniref:CidA/LrgA family protein n=1 Tax=Microbulbifer sp. 2304DJ12-6 TaxID=3233340 RepID=UPI0039AFD10B